MSIEQITPGEWWADGREVGTVPMMNTKIAKVSGESVDEAAANAKLIAQSPELYNCLVGYMSAVDIMNDAMKDGCNVQGAISNLIGWSDRAKWAIQRAGGPDAD